jgi:cellulose synthase operon protein C
MRVQCQQCDAAYGIDDKFVTVKGIRAQCPKCKHLQLVRKEAPTEPASPALPPIEAVSPFLFDAQPKANAVPASAAPSPVPRAPPKPQSSAAFSFDSPAPQIVETADPAPFDFGFGNAQAIDLAEPPASSGESMQIVEETPDALESNLQPNCEVCGKVLSDPFDQAIGKCDACRGSGVVRAPSLAEPAATDSSGGASLRLTLTRQPTETEVRPSGGYERASSSSASVRPSARSSMVRNSLLVTLALALVAAAGWLLVTKPWVKVAPPLVVAQVPLSDSGKRLQEQWRLRYASLLGQSRAKAAPLVESGEKALALDSTAGYREARTAFEQALVLDGEDVRALAGWVLSLAFDPVAAQDTQTLDAALSMLAVAERQTGSPRLYAAHANLMVLRGDNANDVIAVADNGKLSNEKPVLALSLLAIAQAHLSRNAQTAETVIEAAIAADGSLKRAQLVHAKILAIRGRFGPATAMLEKRLETDASSWEAAEMLASLLAEALETDKAKSLLEKHVAAFPKALAPVALLSALSFARDGNAEASAQRIAKALSTADAAGADSVEALIRQATFLRLLGDFDGAEAAAASALKVAPESAPARFAHLMAMIRKGVASQARLDVDALAGKWPTPAFGALAEGRVALLEGRLEESLKVFETAAASDGLRADAMLLSGAVSARLKRDGKAWEWCLRKAAMAEPSVPSQGVLSLWFVSPQEILEPARGAFSGLGNVKMNDPNVHFCEGLTAYFSNDTAQAEMLFARALGPDPKNPDALSFRALTALRRSEVNAALRYAQQAVESGRTVGLAHAALAAVKLKIGKVDDAQSESTQALRYAPHLLLAKTVSAEAQAKLKRPDEARKLLVGVLLTSPNYQEAKRVLYKYGL